MKNQQEGDQQAPSSPAQPAEGEGPIRDKAAATVLLDPAATNAMAINRIAKMRTPFSPAVLAAALSDQIAKLNSGSLDQVEGILLAQTHTLDHLFVAMVRRALDAPTIEQGEICMRLAFRAQGQSRASIETLAAIKSPGAVAFRQTNIAGIMQVNNGAVNDAAQGESLIGKNQPNELLEQQNEQQWLDTRAATTPRDIDSQLEAVGAIDRTKNHGG